MKITNTQPGPRGINAISGSVLVEPGQTVEIEVYARERQHIEASGWFEVEGKYTADPGAAAQTGGAENSGEVTALKDRVAELELENEELKKKLPETEIDKMTVPELRAHLAFHDVAYDGSKDKKADLLELAKTAAAPK